MTTTTSRTGLVPTQRKNLRLVQKLSKSREDDQLPKKFEATPMALSLRPFGGLYNPYAKGCSVLCNHPAPSGVRDIINQLKHTLNNEGKNIQLAKEKLDAVHFHETDNIPEDLFRRYTDTDSRPLTPSPTVTGSVRTRTSAASFLNRRCITPEFGKTENNKRKKIILDLRRSHSQETLYWKPTSDVSQGTTGVAISDTDQKAKSAGADLDRRTVRQKSAEQRPKSSLATTSLPADEATDAGVEKKLPQTCINEQCLDDEDVRRGKKRKKLKTVAATTTSFRQNEDPETQVGALGPDSLNASTRPSLIPICASLLPNKDKRESEPVLLKGSFLTDEAFQALKSELNVDTIENTFGRYLNRALREAIKYMPPKPKFVEQITEEIENLSCEPSGKMPRKFSKSATRFEVPLNLSALEKMTVIEYLSKYVWVSRQRKQLYKRVFLKYLTRTATPVPAEDFAPTTAAEDLEMQTQLTEYIERTMSLQHLAQALEDVMEFYGTERNISGILRLLDYENLKMEELDFRTWCGIVSFAERFAQDEINNTDSCDELEKVDFYSMAQRLDYYSIPENLHEVFCIIKRCHFMPL